MCNNLKATLRILNQTTWLWFRRACGCLVPKTVLTNAGYTLHNLPSHRIAVLLTLHNCLGYHLVAFVCTVHNILIQSPTTLSGVQTTFHNQTQARMETGNNEALNKHTV